MARNMENSGKQYAGKTNRADNSKQLKVENKTESKTESKTTSRAANKATNARNCK